MFISIKYKFIFFHIPKTAGTAIKSTLSEMVELSGENERNLRNIRLSSQKKIPSFFMPPISHIEQNSLKKVLNAIELNTDFFYEFTFVRHPYTRLVSQYNFDNSFKTNRKCKNFDEFLDRYEFNSYQDPTSINWYKSQIFWLEQPLTSNIKTYKYEEIDKSWNELRDKLNLDLPNLSIRNNTKNKIIDDIDARHKERIHRLFKKEFDILGYEK